MDSYLGEATKQESCQEAIGDITHLDSPNPYTGDMECYMPPTVIT